MNSRWSRVSALRDPALAGALCALGELELFGHERYNNKPVWPGPVWLNAVLIAVLTLPLAWRRRRALTAVLVIFGAMTISSLTLGAPEAATVFIVLVAAAYSGAAYSRHLVIVTAAALIAAVAHGVNDPASMGLADLTWTYGLVAISVLIGRAVWSRQHRIGSLEADAATSAQRHAREIAAATAAERASIARELHDIVSHAVSVIVIQSQVGSRALPTDLDVVADSLTAIEASARSAMAELRQLLTLLTDDAEPAAVAPMASLRQLDELISQCRAAGLSVDTDIETGVASSPLSAVADLAAYRVIQEALTNTMRHAPGATARITLQRTGGMLELVAEDSGGTSVSRAVIGGAGRGLIGMRERLALVGGQLVEAEHYGNGFRVRAVIPTHEATMAEPVS